MEYHHFIHTVWIAYIAAWPRQLFGRSTNRRQQVWQPSLMSRLAGVRCPVSGPGTKRRPFIALHVNSIGNLSPNPNLFTISDEQNTIGRGCISSESCFPQIIRSYNSVRTACSVSIYSVMFRCSLMMDGKYGRKSRFYVLIVQFISVLQLTYGL